MRFRRFGLVKDLFSRYGVPISLFMAVLLCVGGITWLLKVRPNAVVPVTPTTPLPNGVEMRLNHVIFRGISDGKIVWEVLADHFDMTRNQLTFHVSGLKKVALLKEGKQQFTLSADGLERNTQTGDIIINGHVMVMGNDIVLRSPMLTWSDRLQLLSFPQPLAGQLGDITVTAKKGATFKADASTLRCDGQLTVGFRGNLLRAAGAVVEGASQSFTLHGPIEASIQVADAQQWSVGKNLPKIPPIPPDVKARYRDYCRQRGIQ